MVFYNLKKKVNKNLKTFNLNSGPQQPSAHGNGNNISTTFFKLIEFFKSSSQTIKKSLLIIKTGFLVLYSRASCF
jgi:hypothetical protein